MKALPFLSALLLACLAVLLALLLAWLAVAGGYHLTSYPHFLGGGGPAPFGLIICFPPEVPEARHFGVAVALLGPLGLVLSAWLALWGFWQRRGGAYPASGSGLGNNRDIWLAG